MTPPAPLVSCIMPTRQRRSFVQGAIRHFLEQTYEPRELLIVDDGDDAIADLVPDDPRIRYLRIAPRRSIGWKRNHACELAKGSLVAHFDDDDWMAPWRLAYQVERLLASNADACGLDRLLYFDEAADRAWRYVYPRGQRAWLAGGTLVFRKTLWEKNKFPDRDIGEDTAFVWGKANLKLLVLDDERFYVARKHSQNTAPKRINDGRWTPISTQIVRDLIGAGAVPAASVKISCVKPTKDPPYHARRAIEYFQRQDHPSAELIVVDSGTRPLSDLGGEIRYVRAAPRISLGGARNLGVEHARGEVIVQWDDDDWSGPTRLTQQTTPIFEDRADIAGFTTPLFIDLAGARLFTASPALHAQMFYGDIHGRSLAIRRALFARGLRYPDRSQGEDADLLRQARARVTRLDGRGLFAYVRHATNNWKFPFTGSGWSQVSCPDWLPRTDLEYYENLSGKKF